MKCYSKVMLSNSETENSKAVKGTSPKLPSESESGTKPSNFEKDKGGKTILRKNTYHTTVISSRKSDTRVRPRTKIKDDFVSGRGRYEEKRGYRGSRGGGTSRKDRDETSYSRNIKFHDSLNKSKGYGSYTSNNEYETGRGKCCTANVLWKLYCSRIDMYRIIICKITTIVER